MKTRHSKQVLVGLSVFSDSVLHFLQIKNFFFFLPKLSCGFNRHNLVLPLTSSTFTLSDHARPKGGGGGCDGCDCTLLLDVIFKIIIFFFLFFFCLRACYRGWWCTKIPLPRVWKIDPDFLRLIKKIVFITSKTEYSCFQNHIPNIPGKCSLDLMSTPNPNGDGAAIHSSIYFCKIRKLVSCPRARVGSGPLCWMQPVITCTASK